MSLADALIPFRIIRGSSYPQLIQTLKNPEGSPVDLTAATSARLVVAKDFETATVSLSLDLAMAFASDRTTGKVSISLTSAQTSPLAAQEYQAQVEVVFGSDTAKFGPFAFLVDASVRGS